MIITEMKTMVVIKMVMWLHCCFDKQGGFAKCYELTDSQTQEIFAGKVVPKSLLIKPHQKEKVCSSEMTFNDLHNWATAIH